MALGFLKETRNPRGYYCPVRQAVIWMKSTVYWQLPCHLGRRPSPSSPCRSLTPARPISNAPHRTSPPPSPALVRYQINQVPARQAGPRA